VFQFESRGMQGMLRDAKPSRLEDLIALNAMFRPGPMENIPSFCARKNGKEEVVYPHPLLGRCWSETYGIFVYQEQVMQAAQVMGGYSLGGADLLRRAMGKKKAEEMAKHRDLPRRRDGQGHRREEGRRGLRPDGEVRGLRLQQEPCRRVFAAGLPHGLDQGALHGRVLRRQHDHRAGRHRQAQGAAERRQAVRHALRAAGREPRHLPLRADRATRRVRYGLGAVKGTGQGAIEAIVAAREGGRQGGGGPFRSLFDFCARVDRKRGQQACGRSADQGRCLRRAARRPRQPALASVAWPSTGPRRRPPTPRRAGCSTSGEDSHGSSTQEPALVAVDPWGIRERLQLEKTAIGFYLSGHLFDACASEVRRFCRRPIADLVDSREPQVLAGIVTDARLINGRSGKVLIFKLDDGSEAIEAVANDDALGVQRELMKEDELVVIQGKLQPDRFAGGLRLNVQQVWDLPAARARFGRYLRVDVNGPMPPVADLVRQWPARRVETEHGELRRACWCGCACSGRRSRPRSSSATTAASGPATRRWHAGARPPRAARRWFCTNSARRALRLQCAACTRLR
jgi:DNA polymerase-3 subunit alpha